MRLRSIESLSWPGIVLLLLLALSAWSAAQTIPLTSGPVLPLYRELRGVGLDAHQVYQIREADIDREDIHISLNDGTIAFTQAVDGRITGAFFIGDGEVLVRPPDRMERASLGLFTQTGVLEEKFASAYFRFNDDTAKQLQPFLRAASPDAADFVAQNDSHARMLATMDAMRLCISFTSAPESAAANDPGFVPDKFFHARVASEHYGIFDIYFDTRSPEQIVVGKTSSQGEQVYYDLWMSFPMSSLRKRPTRNRFQGPTGPAWTRDALTVDKYTIVGRLDPLHDLAAEATLDAQVKQGGTRIVLFELSRYLQLKNVQVGNTALEFIQNEAVEGSELARRGNDIVAVVFAGPLQSGTRLSLKFRYSGSVLADAGGGLLYVGARGTWYPNRGIAMANYDLTFRYPRPWTLVATGKQVSLEPDGDYLVGRWVSQTPMPIAGFNLGRYRHNVAKAGDVAVNSYAAEGSGEPDSKPTLMASDPRSPRSTATVDVAGPPVNAGSGQQALANRAAEVLAAYEKILGPYPFNSLELTQRPSADSQGWPGLIFLSSYVYMTPDELAALKMSDFDKLIYNQIMVPHEIAHQWFGDEVSWASYHEQWLLEALANYCALLLLERNGPSDANAALQGYRQMLALKNKAGRQFVEAGPVTLGARLSSSQFANGYEVITYGRGTWIIHMLRTMLRDASRTPQNPDGNDDVFLSLLRKIVDQYQGREITNLEFEQAVESVLPKSLWFEDSKSLDWFFDGWVNGTAFPRLELSDAKVTSRGSTATATGVIKQASAPSDLVTSVPVYGIAGDRKIYLGRVFAEGDETRFSLPAPREVSKLVLDPNQTVLTAP